MKAESIKALRLEKKMTQSQLGDICGVEKASVSKWEKGKNRPSGAALKILKSLAIGDLVISRVSDLELKLLDENVRAGAFTTREEYLTVSLKHLLLHGKFLTLPPRGGGLELMVSTRIAQAGRRGISEVSLQMETDLSPKSIRRIVIELIDNKVAERIGDRIRFTAKGIKANAEWVKTVRETN
jgi:transcriptional regulator with XRE-family HTH domain